jgi:hypothetical protein
VAPDGNAHGDLLVAAPSRYRGGTHPRLARSDMPKSKVRKKPVYTPPNEARTTIPVKVAGPTHPVYVAVFLALMLAGLAWLVVNYLAQESIPFMAALGSWNFLIGFALIVIGLLMTMRWR